MLGQYSAYEPHSQSYLYPEVQWDMFKLDPSEKSLYLSDCDWESNGKCKINHRIIKIICIKNFIIEMHIYDSFILFWMQGRRLLSSKLSF